MADLEKCAGAQTLDLGVAAFSLGWSVKRRVLAVGGHAELRLFMVRICEPIPQAMGLVPRIPGHSQSEDLFEGPTRFGAL